MASVSSWDSIFTLVLFIMTNAVMLFPVTVHICCPYFVASTAKRILETTRIISTQSASSPSPRTCKGSTSRLLWKKLCIDYQVAPVAAVLLLLATTAIDGSVVRDGIVGTDGVHPLDIMALFISLAYLSISLDTTGLLRYLAFKVARRGGASGKRLYFYFYIFFLVAALIVGNDPVVLSGTAFLAYFTRVSGIVPPTAWTYSQFAAANVASAVLPPSNPTNLILTSAFSITFTSFAGHTILPVLASATFVYPLMAYWLFRSPTALIPLEIDIDIDALGPKDETDSPRGSKTHVVLERRGPTAPAPDELSDKFGAALGSTLLVGGLVVLVATSPLPRPIPVWRITVPPALLMLAYDIWSDIRRMPWPKKTGQNANNEATKAAAADIELDTLPVDSSIPSKKENWSLSPVLTPNNTRHDRTPRTTFQSLVRDLASRFPTITSLLPRLPVSLVPFALSMFILVNALASKGWVEVFAGWWASWVGVCFRSGGEKGAVVGAAGLMAIFSVLLCNICGTNIGATILLARILKSWVMSMSPSSRLVTASLYTLALGSNYGAFSLHPGASLAGLLWRDILWRKGISTRSSEFARSNIWIVAVAMIVGTGIVVAEVFVVA